MTVETLTGAPSAPKLSWDSHLKGYKEGLENDEAEEKINSIDDIVDIKNPISSQILLIHTMGSCTIQEDRGDGAYAKWMNDYFQHNSKVIKHHWIRIPGKGNQENPELNELLLNQYIEFLEKHKVKKGDIVLLNWHIRYTGRPNSWTGRGFSSNIINKLTNERKDVTLKVVLTIHEYQGLKKISLNNVEAIIALNSKIKEEIISKNPEKKVYLSAVPNLMGSTVTKITDKILEYLGEDPNTNLASACIIGELKQRTYVYKESLNITSKQKKTKTNFEQLKNLKHGIVIFGSVVERHGTTVENIIALCDAFKNQNLDNFFILIAGSCPANSKLVKNIKEEISDKKIIITDTIDDFDILAKCKYAISFDELGFRDNASAMINLIRSGYILFHREQQKETNKNLIKRAVEQIFSCEENKAEYINAIERQQNHFIRLSQKSVGEGLMNIFKEISMEPSKTKVEMFDIGKPNTISIA